MNIGKTDNAPKGILARGKGWRVWVSVLALIILVWWIVVSFGSLFR